MDEKICRLCTKSVPEDAKHCPYCGGRFPKEGPMLRMPDLQKQAPIGNYPYPSNITISVSPNIVTGQSGYSGGLRSITISAGLCWSGVILELDDDGVIHEKHATFGLRDGKMKVQYDI